MSVTRCKISIGIDVESTVARGPSTPKDIFRDISTTTYGVGQAPGPHNVENEWSDTRIILVAGNDDIDLSGALVNKIGELAIFTTIQVFYLRNLSAVASLVITGGTNPAPLFLGTVEPGARFVYDAGATSPGKTITPGTADTIRITSNAPDASYAILFAGAAIFNPASATANATTAATGTLSLTGGESANALITTGASASLSAALPLAATANATTSSYAASTAPVITP